MGKAWALKREMHGLGMGNVKNAWECMGMTRLDAWESMGNSGHAWESMGTKREMHGQGMGKAWARHGQHKQCMGKAWVERMGNRILDTWVVAGMHGKAWARHGQHEQCMGKAWARHGYAFV
jgi:hypothetical protein